LSLSWSFLDACFLDTSCPEATSPWITM
jgi:hypothetical protein